LQSSATAFATSHTRRVYQQCDRSTKKHGCGVKNKAGWVSDLANASPCHQLVDRVSATFAGIKQINILVNNVGTNIRNRTVEYVVESGEPSKKKMVREEVKATDVEPVEKGRMPDGRICAWQYVGICCGRLYNPEA